MVDTYKVDGTWTFEADGHIVIGFSSKDEAVLAGIGHLLEKRKTDFLACRKALKQIEGEQQNKDVSELIAIITLTVVYLNILLATLIEYTKE